MPPPLIAGRVY